MPRHGASRRRCWAAPCGICTSQRSTPRSAGACAASAGFLEDVRQHAARAKSIDVPKLVEPRRVSWPTLIMMIGTLIGGWALIGVLIDVSKSFDTVIGADWLWVVVAFVLAQLAYVASAVEGIGSVAGPLPFGRAVAVEVANSFSALAGGTAAVFATRVRFYQRQGYDATVALSSGAIMTTSSWIAIAVLFLVSLPFAWGSIHFEVTPESGGDSKLVWIILAVVVLVALAAGLVLAVPRLRRLAAEKARPKVRDIWGNLKQVASSPRKLVLLVGGSFGPGAAGGHGPVRFAAGLRRPSPAAHPDRGHHPGRDHRRRLAVARRHGGGGSGHDPRPHGGRRLGGRRHRRGLHPAPVHFVPAAHLGLDHPRLDAKEGVPMSTAGTRPESSAAPDLTTREGGAPFASTWRRKHLTVEQRVARGRAARNVAPRSGHGRWEPAPRRPDPVALLEEQAASRVPQLVPIRYGRMLVSPFTFYRGAALIMATDLAATPVSGITVQLCGDAHLSNFGLFGTPERRMLFDINDFDETLPGPWEWDVKRLAASFEVMGRDRGFTPADRRAVVMAGVKEYRDRMRQAAGMSSLDAWYEHLEAGMLLKMVRKEVRVKRVTKDDARMTEEMVAKARTRDSTRVFAKRADEVDGELRIVADPPIIIPIEDLVTPGSEWENPDPLIKKLLSSYRRTLGRQHHPLEEYRYVHSAYKMVGVGSVGTRCYIVLMLGRDHNDPLFLQVKEAQASVLERFLPESTYRHHGERVVAGQRLMQGATDIFLGWQSIKGLDGVTRDYYVRQFQDWKGSADVDSLLVPGAVLYSRICGATLARAHARWGDRIAIASYLGKGDTFDRAIADFSAAYADQNERDYAAFKAAIDSGRLTAQTGV